MLILCVYMSKRQPCSHYLVKIYHIFSSELIPSNALGQNTTKSFFYFFPPLTFILRKCYCIAHNKICSLSFCLCHSPNHYCMADHSAAVSATQRWNGRLSTLSATHTLTITFHLGTEWVFVEGLLPLQLVLTRRTLLLWLVFLSFSLLHSVQDCMFSSTCNPHILHSHSESR